MAPRTYEEACEIVTMYVYDNASFHHGLHEIQVRNDRVAWLKSFRDMLADNLSVNEAIDALLKKETDADTRERLLATWVSYVNKYHKLPHRDEPVDDHSDESDDTPEEPFKKSEPSTAKLVVRRLRDRYRDDTPRTTNNRKDVA
jgi:hypothetical protein